MFDFLKSEKDILPVAVEQNEAPVMPSITDPKQLQNDFVNSSKNGLDLEAYCTLQDALERELERLKAEYEQEDEELSMLKAKYKELGMFKLSEKKELQEKIDRKKEEADVIYSNIQIVKAQVTQMRQTFPDSYAMKSDVAAYEQNLQRIEQKFAV